MLSLHLDIIIALEACFCLTSYLKQVTSRKRRIDVISDAAWSRGAAASAAAVSVDRWRVAAEVHWQLLSRAGLLCTRIISTSLLLKIIIVFMRG